MEKPDESGSKSQRWIKLYPGIFQNEALSGPYCETAAWAWMLMRASANEWNGLRRGQFRASLNYMAKAFRWHKSKVRRFLVKLGKNGMIETDTPSDTLTDTPSDTPPTVITICNYSRYQDTLEEPDTLPDTPTDTPTDTNTKKEDTKIQKKNNLNTRARARGVSEDWRPRDEAAMMSLASELNVGYDGCLLQFRDYAIANGKAYKDPDAALRNWIRNEAKWSKQRGRQTQPSGDQAVEQRRTAILHSLTGDLDLEL